MKTYHVQIIKHTRGEWEDSYELEDTKTVDAYGPWDAIRRANVPKGYDIGSTSVTFEAKAFRIQ
jgi:hypothetical protein